MFSAKTPLAVVMVLLLASFVVFPVPVAALPASPSAALTRVDVFANLTTESLMFHPSEFKVPTNATVHVRILQKETAPHTFTVGKEKDVVLPTNLTFSQLDQYFVNNNLTDVAIPGVVGTVVWANFTAPTEAGRYEFVCRIPGHFQTGMFGFMVVEKREVFVNVTTERLLFSPSTFTVQPGATVHVRISQKDSVPHTFTIGKEKDVDLPTSWSSTQLDQYFVDNNLTDVAIPDVVDTVVWANFTAPGEPGRYEFVCRIQGHFQTGMFGFMVVSESEGPTLRSGPLVGLISGIMLGTLAIVLVFAAVYHVRAVRAAKRMK